MNRLLFAVAVALPVAGTIGGVARNEASLRGATEWRIPIDGYDPRDPLRGRYIQFSYIWGADGDARLCGDGDDCRLCLKDGGERVSIVPPTVACAAPVDLMASGLKVFPTSGTQPGRLTAGTRLWVAEARGPQLERQLRSRPMVAVARLTRGGRLVADRLEAAR